MKITIETSDNFPESLYKEAISKLSEQNDLFNDFGTIVTGINKMTRPKVKAVIDEVLSAKVVFSYGVFFGEPNHLLKEIIDKGFQKQVTGIAYYDFGCYLKESLLRLNRTQVEWALANNSFYCISDSKFVRLQLKDLFT